LCKKKIRLVLVVRASCLARQVVGLKLTMQLYLITF
jgi:hypothetical protein